MIYQKLVFLSLTRFSIILTVGDAILMILFATVLVIKITRVCMSNFENMTHCELTYIFKYETIKIKKIYIYILYNELVSFIFMG